MRRLIFFLVFILFFFCVTALRVDAETIGEKRSFFIEPFYDLTKREQITAILIKTTPNLYFYADENWWNFSPQSEIYQALSSLGEEFDNKIYSTITSTFGSEWKPGIDRDPRITILIHPMIKDAGGYFSSKDEYFRLQTADSNEREMVYLNADYIRSSLTKSFLAHEFFHLIMFNQKEKTYGVEEETWLNEARAEYVPTLLGYDDVYEGSNLQRRVQIFSDSPFDSVTEWQNTKYDYASINLFVQYLVDHYGKEILVDSLHSPKVGIDSINFALGRRGINKDFSQIFIEWTIAALVNDCNFGSYYCYLNRNLKDFHIVPKVYFLPLSGKSTLSVSDTSKNWTGNWFKIIGGRGNIKISFITNPGVFLKVPYAKQSKAGSYIIDFLRLDKTQKGEIFIENFGTEIMSFMMIPSFQNKFSGFSNTDPFYSFSWSASVVETQEEAELITQLLKRIEELKAEIAKTQAKIDAILGKTPISCKKLENDLYFGMENNNEVRCLQNFLKSQETEIYPEGLITGNFGPLTQAAVIRFQEKYASEILDPLGLKQGTGIVGPRTRAKINQLLSILNI